ncbi:hypothetical protein CR513_54761, partial [Mucuna pruriens]
MINLGKGLVLHNVLYVPNLACNFISVSQLIHDSNCADTFLTNYDHISRIVISLALTFMQACKTSGVDLFTVWHRCLGHPSSQIVSLLLSIHIGKKDKHEQNKANERLYLIHCDFWGPYCVCSSCGVFYFLTIVDDFSCHVDIFVDRENDSDTKFRVFRGYFIEQGIIHQTFTVDTSQQNDCVQIYPLNFGVNVSSLDQSHLIHYT